MLRCLMRHLALLCIVGGALLVAVPVFAYTDTSPGSGATTSATTAQPGQPFSFTATFTDLPDGTVVSFSAASAAGASCSGITFSPTSAALSGHQASTSVTIPSACAGQSIFLTATGPQGQTVSATVTVAGGFPNTAGAPQGLPIGWIVMAIGLLLLVAGTFGLSRRTRSAAPGGARA